MSQGVWGLILQPVRSVVPHVAVGLILSLWLQSCHCLVLSSIVPPVLSQA